MTAPLFPMFVDLNDRPVVVVGGGVVARRKATALLEAGALVTAIAPSLEPELERLVREGRIRHVSGRFDPSWLEGTWLVVAATDSPSTNRRVAAAARAQRIWANVVDDVGLSSFHVPARVQRGKVQLAISSAGAAPMLARHLRESFETQLDESLGGLAELFAGLRERIRRQLPDLKTRRSFFQRVLDGPAPALVRRGDIAAARRLILAELRATPRSRATGRVSLVGAGPGDPGLLTLRGLRVLNEADVVLHDRLVSPEVLALVRRDAQLVEVGKQAGNHHVTQERIHALMLEHARAGRHVVRLKGGDGFVFGRGGEELEFLRAHAIGFEVVPGITAALACGAYAGIPLTHREHAQSVRFVTAHCRQSVDALDWHGLAAERQTLAIYMGVAGLRELRDRLMAHGRAGSTAVALVENGSRPEQRVVTGTLARLPEIAEQYAVRSPALLFIGEVAALATRLHWFGSPPIDTCGPAPCPARTTTFSTPSEHAA